MTNAENITLIIVCGLVAITFILSLGYVYSPNEFKVTINSDNNTTELYRSIDRVASYENCLNKRYTQNEQENIAENYVDKVTWCTINNKIVENCTAIISHWSDNSTAMQIEYILED